MAIRTDITQAVADELNTGVASGAFGVGVTFAAVRAYEPIKNLSEPKKIYVTVVTRSFAQEPASRISTYIDVMVDVAIQKKVGSDISGNVNIDEIDPLATIVELVVEFFNRKRLSGFPAAVWTNTENQMIYIQDHLSEKRLFTSVITLTYRVMTK